MMMMMMKGNRLAEKYNFRYSTEHKTYGMHCLSWFAVGFKVM